MQVPVLKVLVKQNMYTEIPVFVPPHEIVVLNEVFDGGVSNEEVTGKTMDLEPEEEYARLSRKYGHHPDQHRPYVEVVMGRFGEGRFTKTMKDGAAHYSPKKPRKTRAKKVKVDVKDALAA